ncbi:MAG: hypothetical protein AAF485_32215, partial [Chloroflexota bacterium]
MDPIIFLGLGLLGSLSAVMVIGGVATIVINRPGHAYRDDKDPWYKFAKENDLTFVPSGLFRNRYVFGTYRGQQFKLESVKDSKIAEPAFTWVTMFRDSDQDTSLQNLVSGDEAITEDAISDMFMRLIATQSLQGRLAASLDAKKISYKRLSLEKSPDALQHIFDVLSDIAHDYPVWVALGGEAVPRLQPIAMNPKYMSQPIVVEILRNIAEETKNRLGEDVEKFYCPNCLATCQGYSIKFGWLQHSFTYYGCRLCKRSRAIVSGRHLCSGRRWRFGVMPAGCCRYLR